MQEHAPAAKEPQRSAACEALTSGRSGCSSSSCPRASFACIACSAAAASGQLRGPEATDLTALRGAPGEEVRLVCIDAGGITRVATAKIPGAGRAKVRL